MLISINSNLGGQYDKFTSLFSAYSETTINGTNKPWSNTCNITIDKDYGKSIVILKMRRSSDAMGSIQPMQSTSEINSVTFTTANQSNKISLVYYECDDLKAGDTINATTSGMQSWNGTYRIWSMLEATILYK